MHTLIHVEGIHKRFRVSRRQGGLGRAVQALVRRQTEEVHALNDLSFEIPDGEIVGYIGPNGAGKSTTIKVLCGVLVPDSGTCTVDGLVPWRDRVRHVARIGVVFGQRSQLWWDVPVADSFELLRDIYRVPQAAYAARLEKMVHLLRLEELLPTPVRALSLGQRMRCELAASLLHRPRILFLDEPTIGLDAVTKLAVRDFIQRLNRDEGTTVILTTHDMQDIEALAQRILLIGKGRILLDGSLADLHARAQVGPQLTLVYKGARPQPETDMLLLSDEPGRMVLSLSPAQGSLNRAIASLSSQTQVMDVAVHAPSAEEMVAALYREYQL